MARCQANKQERRNGKTHFVAGVVANQCQKALDIAMEVAARPRASKQKKTKENAIVQAVLLILFDHGAHADLHNRRYIVCIRPPQTWLICHYDARAGDCAVCRQLSLACSIRLHAAFVCMQATARAQATANTTCFVPRFWLELGTWNLEPDIELGT